MSKGYKPQWGLKITGVGSALPEKVLTNEDLTAWMDTSDEWIRERTGISQRHIGGTTTGLAIEAAEAAMAEAGCVPDDIDHVVLATTSPDQACPATATAVASSLGLSCGGFDLQAVCSGWVYGLVVVNGLIGQGMRKVLLIGAETLDRITDYNDRGTGILFGNGAGAAVVEADPTNSGQLLSWHLGANGDLGHILYVDHGKKFKMDGREVFRQAVTVLQSSANIALENAGVKAEDIDLIVPHQANVRIVEAAWKKLGFSMEKTAMVLEKTGNTSAASIPLAYDSALQDNRVSPGNLVLFLGFGAGMTWASALIRVSDDFKGEQ